uniref:dihydrofolate reductase n=1 Tax=Callorhinchus milii TaxID=7868 RepID=A0A4W3IZ63_CALMI
MAEINPKSICLIAAAERNMGIGIDGDLPWNLPNELNYFISKVTAVSTPGKKNLLICGRRSCLPSYLSAPNCYFVVLSRTLSAVPDNANYLCQNLNSALQLTSIPPLSEEIETIWVIGGAKLFEEASKHPWCERIYLTEIMADLDCDTFFPQLDFHNTFKLVEGFPGVPKEIQEENGIKYKFQVFQKVPSSGFEN